MTPFQIKVGGVPRRVLQQWAAKISLMFTAKFADTQALMVSGLKGSSRTRVSRALTHLAMLGPAFDSIYFDAHVTVTTACSGTELAIWTLQRLMYSCSDQLSMATTVGHRQLWACDNGKLPIRWMKEVMQTPLVFDDINGLSEEWCKTVLPRNRLRKVQCGSLFATGFSCVDVSNYNTKRSQHKASISRCVGKTGGTFAGACTSRPSDQRWSSWKTSEAFAAKTSRPCCVCLGGLAMLLLLLRIARAITTCHNAEQEFGSGPCCVLTCRL